MARLVFRNGPYAGKSLQIPAGKTVVAGRNRDIDLPLPDLKLSRRHCEISYQNDCFMIRDMGSTNGTYVNGDRISDPIKLTHFDRILIGDLEIEFQVPEAISEEQTRLGMPSPQADPEVPPEAALPSPEPDEQVALPEAQPPAEIPAPEIPEPENLIPEPDDLIPAAAPLPETQEPYVPTEEDVPQQEVLQEVPQEVAPEEAAQALSEAVAATATVRDPLALAIEELNKPLPEEPEPEPQPVVEEPRSELLFCDTCDGSIPMLDLDLGEAKELGGKLICKDCLAKGVSIGPEPPPSEAPASIEDLVEEVAPPPQNISDILKGLGEVEEIELNDQAGEGQQAGAQPAEELPHIPGGSTRMQDAAGFDDATAPQGPPPPPVSEDEINELLGDEFEEIDESDLIGNSGSKTRQNQSDKKRKEEPLLLDEDQDLIEI